MDCAGVYLCNANYLDYIEDLGVDMRLLRPLRRLRRRYEDIIKVDIHVQEMGMGSKDQIDPAQDKGRWRAFVSAVMNFRVP